MRDALALGRADTKSTVTVSTMLYYTPNFRRRVSNYKGRIRSLMDATNAAFARTRIPLQLTEVCIQQLDIRERTTSDQRMRDIRSAKGSESRLMNGADIVIVVMSGGVCIFCTCGLGKRTLHIVIK